MAGQSARILSALSLVLHFLLSLITLLTSTTKHVDTLDKEGMIFSYPWFKESNGWIDDKVSILTYNK